MWGKGGSPPKLKIKELVKNIFKQNMSSISPSPPFVQHQGVFLQQWPLPIVPTCPQLIQLKKLIQTSFGESEPGFLSFHSRKQIQETG